MTEIIDHNGKLHILNGSFMWQHKSETSFNGADCMYPLREESIYKDVLFFSCNRYSYPNDE
ncbi:hypothetical protein CN404_12730 [Bacillus thuringiensis]|nr:hypothetical protein CN404_12730 [Bacillus thuringiensis]